jgi:hypothetical protein
MTILLAFALTLLLSASIAAAIGLQFLAGFAVGVISTLGASAVAFLAAGMAASDHRNTGSIRDAALDGDDLEK